MRPVYIYTSSEYRFAAFFTNGDVSFNDPSWVIDSRFGVGWGDTPALTANKFLKNNICGLPR